MDACAEEVDVFWHSSFDIERHHSNRAGPFFFARPVTAPGVRDIFLDNLPLVNLSPIIVGGAIALWVFAWVLLIVNPRHLIFATKGDRALHHFPCVLF